MGACCGKAHPRDHDDYQQHHDYSRGSAVPYNQQVDKSKISQNSSKKSVKTMKNTVDGVEIKVSKSTNIKIKSKASTYGKGQTTGGGSRSVKKFAGSGQQLGGGNSPVDPREARAAAAEARIATIQGRGLGDKTRVATMNNQQIGQEKLGRIDAACNARRPPIERPMGVGLLAQKGDIAKLDEILSNVRAGKYDVRK